MSLHQFLLEPITCHAWNRDRTRKYYAGFNFVFHLFLPLRQCVDLVMFWIMFKEGVVRYTVLHVTCSIYNQ